MNRTFFLEDIPLEEAKAVFIRALTDAGLWKGLQPERIPVADAYDRVIVEPCWAIISSPHYHASAMDGYALRSKDTAGATETSPLLFNLITNGEPDLDLIRPAQAINTGQPLPSWADSIVMVEKTQPKELGDGRRAIEIYNPLPPWHHVRPMGEDMVASELVLPANHRLRPVDLGALAAAGYESVMVYRRPRAAIIPTGSELVAISSQSDLDRVSQGDESTSLHPKPGEIIETNSLMLAAQIHSWGGIATRWNIVPDDLGAINDAVLKAAIDHDLVLINAGSSAGTEDYTAQVVASLGKLLVHGVAVRPGHPVIMGIIELPESIAREEIHHSIGRKIVPIIGVPGYPVSAALTGEIFVEDLITRWQGRSAGIPPTIRAKVTRKITSHTGDDDFVRVAVGKVDDVVVATPLSRGAGVISSLVRADGILRIPRFSEGVDAGTEVDVHLYRTPAEIEKTIVAIGSHDLTLDLIAQFLAQGSDSCRLSSANVGSLSGLLALRRGEAHVAGSHLLDEKSGLYNESFVRQYLPDREIILLTLVGREQGWIVPKGNPKGVAAWNDAARPEIRIINRQKGAGTRQLLDYELTKAGIRPEMVRGYERQEFTHLAVAAAVASGTADAGVGIRAAAKALNCDFVPLTEERFDLVIRQKHYESQLLQPLLKLLENREFKAAVDALPGYDTSIMGQLRHISPNLSGDISAAE